MSVSKRKDHRFDLRATADQKSAIEQAALIKQTSATGFIMDTAYETAQKIIRDQSRIVVSTADWNALCAALDSPPEVNPALVKLMTRKSKLRKD